MGANVRKPAILVLEDGRVFRGRSFGADGEFTSEVVFNTALSGYQEILTDPSYSGQFVTYTMPIIGITGVNSVDSESDGPHAKGMIVRECSRIVSNFRAEQSLPEYLKEHNIAGIEGIDTRALVLHIRNQGSMNGIISTEDFDVDSLRVKLAKAPQMDGLDLASRVTCREAYKFDNSDSKIWHEPFAVGAPKEWSSSKVVLVDFGVKKSILRSLARRGCEVTVVPSQTSAEAILEMAPDGVMLSNGPGDPKAVTYGISLAQQLVGRLPVFGICLGHQILGLAMGAKSYKMKFGHRGGNHPVIEVDTGVVSITSQNHGFAIDHDSLQNTPMVMTHKSLNDQTVEGMKHREYPVYSIQFHPEAGPGPHDGEPLFDRFVESLRKESV